MHEASIAQSILDVTREISGRHPSVVRTVRVEIGEMSGVLADAVEFCFDAITAGTEWSHVELVIDSIPFVVQCHRCNRTEHNPSGFTICPRCGGPDTTIISGTDMIVREIQVEESDS
jgi:hydrogenase nickel incorporation protein HypA/HybF